MEEVEITILTSKTKILNSVFNFSMSMFALLWLIIFPLMSFKIDAPKLVGYLMLLSFLFVVLALGALLVEVFYRNKVLLARTHNYKLILNSDQVNLEKVEKSVNYSGNFLLDLHSHTRYELTAKQAIHLLRLAKEDSWIIEAHPTKTNFWEASPKEVFQGLASILWAAS